MPLILAIDTTQPAGSIALAAAGVLLEMRAIHAPPVGFSGVIYDELAALLDRHGVTLPQIDGYAAANGPGSFTGVRVGLTAAKGLAEAHGKLVVPVSNLLAIAALAQPLTPQLTQSVLCPIIDVRRGEVAAAVYSNALELLIAPFSAEPAEVTRRVAGCAEECGAVVYCGADAPRFFPGAVETSPYLAGSVALIAERDLAAGRGLDPASADADYVRRADIGPPMHS
jgi:tRNA threonylcarbamoyladenosine biosynthesis protein TsaB